MGRVKQDMFRLEGVKSVALSAALEAGAVKECPVHEDLIFDCLDPDAASHAYAIATNKWKEGYVDGEREELMNAVKEVIDESSIDDICPYCAKD